MGCTVDVLADGAEPGQQVSHAGWKAFPQPGHFHGFGWPSRAEYPQHPTVHFLTGGELTFGCT